MTTGWQELDQLMETEEEPETEETGSEPENTELPEQLEPEEIRSLGHSPIPFIAEELEQPTIESEGTQYLGLTPEAEVHFHEFPITTKEDQGTQCTLLRPAPRPSANQVIKMHSDASTQCDLPCLHLWIDKLYNYS